MENKRKFSIFISSTYEDLKDERQALVGVALESNFIPVGMEQFHAAPTSQWNVITKMIDECDLYLLIIGGRYGTIEEEAGISYTEKEYNYAKNKELPVLVLIKNPLTINENKKDTGDDKFDKMKKLENFREKVTHDENTVDFFKDLNDLKYKASATFKNALEYVDENAGWVRYRDVMDIINEEIDGRNKENDEFKEYKNKNLEDMKEMLSQFGSRLTDLENNQLTFEKIPTVTEEDIEKLFQNENDMSIIRNKEVDKPIVGQDNVGYIPPDSALLLVYAADGDGRIIKIRTTSSPTQIFTSGKQFMADNSKRESARWVEALDRLIEWKWVKPVGYKGEIFELTGTGYDKADWLKESMRIDTSKNPLDELKEFENFIYV
ncbi:DUF4062 domain-containing protein [Faecalibacillus faecis]|uniref:DUF4062 domain-containing protein n=1 Tax=Faecalibacillus faecis TaxID=1982628 RepID=UPI000E4F4993|nr:DUF4062 domain-containing protein [Faecalibacillus faecis]RHH06838.1 DUF4062 domain-containing protein [Coprobacillus sp. AM18-4LB-d2]RHQ84717.1 DUF4062 domain-containing protein [Coprobacillus sp. AF21-8LB]